MWFELYLQRLIEQNSSDVEQLDCCWSRGNSNLYWAIFSTPPIDQIKYISPNILWLTDIKKFRM